MAKLVDAPDLGSGVAIRVGSSPIRRTASLLVLRFSIEQGGFLSLSPFRFRRQARIRYSNAIICARRLYKKFFRLGAVQCKVICNFANSKLIHQAIISQNYETSSFLFGTFLGTFLLQKCATGNGVSTNNPRHSREIQWRLGFRHLASTMRFWRAHTGFYGPHKMWRLHC